MNYFSKNKYKYKFNLFIKLHRKSVVKLDKIIL